jgi:dethiobiotin synthetase
VAARGVFIAGTDTEVGKTRVAVDMVRALVREGLKVAVMKPVAAGVVETPGGPRNADAFDLMAAANVKVPYKSVNPFCLTVPASPHIAARIAGIRIDLDIIEREFAAIASRPEIDRVVVEGAGGWLAPINDTESMADVAVTLGLPVILVVGLRLGCLNHALLTAQAIRASGLTFAGWIANHVQPRFEHADENIALLEQRLDAPLLESVAFDASGFASGTAAGRLKDASRLW